MSYTLSPNMSLKIPMVGSEPGPDYADDINYDLLNVLDTHDHTPGNGVQLTPASININTNLTFAGNSATNLATAQFTAQSGTPTPVDSLYVSGTDLYFVDGLGNNIRFTQSGSIVGTPGSITGLVAPASATYVPGSSTFVWQSNTSIAANMDFGSALFRNLSPNSTNAITLSAPASLAANHQLYLPTVPATNNFLQLNSSGSMVATIPISAGLTTANISASAGITGGQLAANTITAANIAAGTITNVEIGTHTILESNINDNAIITRTIDDQNVTPDKLLPMGRASSGDINFSTSSTSYVDVTGLTVSAQTNSTLGRPLWIQLTSEGIGECSVKVSSNNPSAPQATRARVAFLIAGTIVCEMDLGSPSDPNGIILPATAFAYFSYLTYTGTPTVKVQAKVVSPGAYTTTITFTNCILLVKGM